MNDGVLAGKVLQYLLKHNCHRAAAAFREEMPQCTDGVGEQCECVSFLFLDFLMFLPSTQTHPR
jgi:hypothetical protein